MNIEKIKNYNQKMLALLSTILVILAVIGLISLIIVVISEIFPQRRIDSNELLVGDKFKKLKKENLRAQILTYDEPYLVDTAKLVYLIPVSVKTLKKPEKEEYEDLAMDLADISSSPGFERKYKSRNFYGSFNNLLIYDYRENKVRKICNSRIIGSDMSVEYFKDETVLLFTGSDADTDKDGKITPSDFQSLFIYSFADKKLRKIENSNATITSFKFVENTKDILIMFGIDRNKDLIFDSMVEPLSIMKYDYQHDALSLVVDKTLETELQKILDKN